MSIKAMKQALEAIEEIALAGMSGTGQESDEAMTRWHARRAWEFIRIAAIAKEPLSAAIAEVDKQDDYKRGFSDGQKEFAEIAGGEWQRVVIDQLVIHHAYKKEHDTDPAKAVHDLLCVSNGLAAEYAEHMKAVDRAIEAKILGKKS